MLGCSIMCRMRNERLAGKLLLPDTESNPDFVVRRESLYLVLDTVYRFEGAEMIHRSSVYQHSRRVAPLALELGSSIPEAVTREVDFDKIERFGNGHDLPEARTGDIPTPVKDVFTPEQRRLHIEKERKIMEELADEYLPEFKELLLADFDEVSAKETTEAQIITIADKWDALCEVITDIRSGNVTPEIEQIYARYIKIFSGLYNKSVMTVLRQQLNFEIYPIPTLEEVQNLSKIDPTELLDGDNTDRFWQRVFDPKLPPLYLYWLKYGTLPNTNDLGIFPGWKSQLPNKPMSYEQRKELLYR